MPDTWSDDLMPSEIQAAESEDVKYPYADKCPVVLLLDTSGSMRGNPIKELNEGVKLLIQELLNDPEAKQRVEVAVITFGGTVKVVQDFKLPEDSNIQDFKAGGGTPMGEAIERGISLLTERKRKLREQGINYYRPWLVLITDGYPTDMKLGDSKYRRIKDNLYRQEKEKHLIAWFFGTDSANFEFLKDLHPGINGRVYQLRGYRFKEIFKWLSASMSAVSRSQPGQKAGIPNPASISESILEIPI